MRSYISGYPSASSVASRSRNVLFFLGSSSEKTEDEKVQSRRRKRRRFADEKGFIRTN